MELCLYVIINVKTEFHYLILFDINLNSINPGEWAR